MSTDPPDGGDGVGKVLGQQDTSSPSGISEEEFLRLNHELIKVKSELYETKQKLKTNSGKKMNAFQGLTGVYNKGETALLKQQIASLKKQVSQNIEVKDQRDALEERNKMFTQQNKQLKEMIRALQQNATPSEVKASKEDKQSSSPEELKNSQDKNEEDHAIPSTLNSSDLNTKMMASIQKKDELLRKSQEDMERLMQKLGEKENEIFQLQNKNTDIAVLQKQIKEKDRQLKKMSQADAKSKQYNDQVHKLTQALTGAHNKNTELLKEVNNLKQQMWIKDKAVADADQLITSTELLCQSQKKKVAELTSLIETSSNRHNTEKRMLEEEAGKAKNFHQEKNFTSTHRMG